MKKRSLHVTLLLILATQSSCRSSYVKTSWADPKYKPRPIDSVLIIGISENQSAIRLYEDTFVARLKQENVKATAAYNHLPTDVKPDRAAIEAAIKATGAATVLITRVMGVSQKTEYTPPQSPYYPRYYGGMYGYYSVAYSDAYTPGYYSSYEVHRLANNLYDSSTAKLIWTAESETIDPEDVGTAIKDIVDILIEDLRSKKLL